MGAPKAHRRCWLYPAVEGVLLAVDAGSKVEHLTLNLTGTVSASPSLFPSFSLGVQLPGRAISCRRLNCDRLGRCPASRSFLVSSIAFNLAGHLEAVFAHLDRQPLAL
jgi:hypothetical protein